MSLEGLCHLLKRPEMLHESEFSSTDGDLLLKLLASPRDELDMVGDGDRSIPGRRRLLYPGAPCLGIIDRMAILPRPIACVISEVLDGVGDSDRCRL